jgi:hypothetical protein
MFDPICRELAEHFLPDADEAVLDAFAEDMQFQVELWCSHDPRSPECEPEVKPLEATTCRKPVRGPLGSVVGRCELHEGHDIDCKINGVTEQDMVDRLTALEKTP